MALVITGLCCLLPQTGFAEGIPALKVLEGTPRKLRRRTELRFYLALRSFYACLFARELVAAVESVLQREGGVP